ncbi:MAG: mechanosensitive ion channel family protein [Eggerthellaceae bacterium]|nr:mechanosensitive ion channel family protein [Eggerthellaceae bacterium]
MDGIVQWIHNLVQGDNLQQWVVAILIVIITFVVSRLVAALIRRVTSLDGVPLPSSSILVNIARIAIWVVGLSVMLSACFDVDVNGLLAALGVGGIALSLGLQDTIKNFIGGLQVTLMRIVRPGDHVRIGTTEGIVQDVTWRQTVVKDYENNVHLIPNAVINSTEVEKIEPSYIVTTNLSFTNDTRDLDAMVREMEQLAKHAVEEVAELEKDPWILLTEIGEYGTWAKMRFVLKDVTHAREARDAALRAVSVYTRVNASEVLHDDGEED